MVGTLGVLVAGGAGIRLAEGRLPAKPKALATLGEVTLLERSVRVLAGLCDEVVLAAPASLVLPLPSGMGSRGRLRRIDDRPGALGPLAGIVAGLAVSPFERAIVLGVDFPFMVPAFLAALLEELGGDHAAVPAPAGIAQPLAAAYSPAASSILAACHAGGEGAPTRALRSLVVRRLDDAALARLPGGAACLFNLNTPDDLREAERRMAARAAS